MTGWLYDLINIMANSVIQKYFAKTWGVSLGIFLKSVQTSPTAQGGILGSISEFLLKTELEKNGYEVKRIKEKEKGWKKPRNHHPDLINRLFPGLKDGTKTYDVQSIMKKILVLETHFVSGKSKSVGRKIATIRNDESNIISIDLFARIKKHKFIFVKPKDFPPSKNYSFHLQQNYIIDILIPDENKQLTIPTPWSEDFNFIFNSLGRPINKSKMRVDERSF